MTTPYTYLIGWSKQDRWYYGVRFAQNCNPELFWVDYFTSSEKVKTFREKYGEPDVIQIRRIFDSTDKARIWEHKVLTRLKVIENEKWLNLATGKAPPHKSGDQNPFKGKNHNEYSKLLMSETKKRNNRKKKMIDINNGVRNAVIYAHQLSFYETRGWVSGKLSVFNIEEVGGPSIKPPAEVQMFR